MRNIKSVSELRRAYPELVAEIEEKALSLFGFTEEEKKKALNPSEREQIRIRAKKLAGL